MNLNSVIIMGNLTKNPETKKTPSTKSVCTFSIANNRSYLKNDEKKVQVFYFDIEVWGPVGESCAKYLSKGRGVIVEGRLEQERWEQDGKKRSRTKIVASAVHFLPQKQKNDEAQDSSLEEEAPLVTSEEAAWQE